MCCTIGNPTFPGMPDAVQDVQLMSHSEEV